ncbi:alpha beta hydrolase [Cryptosporidium ubiquitum]|uniref:Alpha beta hydrolase n=1 Tax=Cryptosporidium ubiquitum TaxID=857276 RepID=A0A1J4MNV6_9CRYT|nr:alpha beta hydrolase [Cryptosporidium ubiquitum]OII74700.1 alpha beta hydrolase [Cryptosporidium ubiquitum]
MVIQKFVDVAMFPGTYSSYDITSYPETILIPGPIDGGRKIPCFLFAPRSNSKILVIYAHANGVDIGEIHGRLRYVSERLRVNMLLFDYPGYGKFEGRSDESSVDQCMNVLLNFATQELNWPIENIILWGCSIGTGPSTRKAKVLNEQKKKLGGLILQCPYKSIKHAAESLAGKIGRFLISQRWNIQSEIMDCSCPILWIHGKKDSLFSWHGSLEMYNSYHTHLRSCHFPKDANHHYFDIEVDIIQPIQQFINKFVLPNTLPIFDGNSIRNGKKVKFNINKSYNSKLNPFRPTILDVYLTRNTNVKMSRDINLSCEKKSNDISSSIQIDDETNNIRIIGPKDIKSILPFWGSNKKEVNSAIINPKNTIYLEGDFTPKYIWLNGEAGEYIKYSRENISKANSSSSIYLSSSEEDEFENNNDYDSEFDNETDSNQSDGDSNEEFNCYNRLVNSNLISSNQMFHKNIKQCISYNNINTNVYSIYNNTFEKSRKYNLRKRNVILNNPSVFRMECRNRMERLNLRSFVKNEELLLNFWPITNLYCYLFDQYYQFFQIILKKLKQGNFSFIKNGNDTFLSIIMWVRRLYYLYTPTLFMNSIYSYNSDTDQWILEGVTIGNIYIQLKNIDGINGRLAVRLLDKYPISSNFSPPFYIVLPLYVPPKPFFQPIAEWIVRNIYRFHVYNQVKSNRSPKHKDLLISQKYTNIDSFNDPINQLETRCLLEELSFSSLQHFLLSNTRPKIEKLALITGFGNWVPFGWFEFFVKLFETNSKHYLQRLLFLNNEEININGNDFINLLVPFYLPSFVNLKIMYKIIKTKIKTRDEWIDSMKTVSSSQEQENEIKNLIHPDICNNIFSNLMIVINTSIKITDGLNFHNNVVEHSNLKPNTQNNFLLQNNQLNWEEILKDFGSFSYFMSQINFRIPKLSFPGISQAFRGRQNTENQKSNSEKKNVSINSTSNQSLEINSIFENIEFGEKNQSVDSNEFNSGKILEIEGDKIEGFHDEIESPEQTIIRSFQGKIIVIDNSSDFIQPDDNEKNFSNDSEKLIEKTSRNSELPLTWESVFLNSQDPLLIINQLQYHDRIYMGMSPSNYIILHRSLYEKYSFLRLNYESEYLFRLLWHFSHCCIYHGNLLNSSALNKNFRSSVIHPLQCILLIIGILRRSLENPSNSDLTQLNWERDHNDEQYSGFNSSCINSSLNKKLNIIERILAISAELLENGVCNSIVNYQINCKSNCDPLVLGSKIQSVLDSRNESSIDSSSNNLTNMSSDLEESYEKNANLKGVTSMDYMNNLSNDSSLSSSRISSFESMIQKVYDCNIKNNELPITNEKQPRKVVIYSSTTRALNKNNFLREDTGFLKRIVKNKKQIKETRIINVNQETKQFNKFSPLRINHDFDEPHNQNIFRSIGFESKSAICKKNLESCRGDKLQSKFKAFTSSPLRIFKK